jgi:hypothetical protein
MKRGGKFILFLLLLCGCAGPLPRREASRAEKELYEEKKETAPPTFTYRP